MSHRQRSDVGDSVRGLVYKVLKRGEEPVGYSVKGNEVGVTTRMHSVL